MNTEFAAQSQTVRMNRNDTLEFIGRCLVGVQVLNHDDSIRRQFRLYRMAGGYVAERIDEPGTIDVRYWGAECRDTMAVYDFFGNEPLANYLYGAAGLSVPGLRLEP